ncbi:hypothetical protein [Bradyrhizobium sp. AS23.2]|uniref:hypothetical protein n=1 Tax=Bradyrhizobium sp. AS23.2 TaxID=1680155 RepID=UPI0011614A46|nr:hypothetical protein [Bradyrhizobium sp. AS23.2]
MDKAATSVIPGRATWREPGIHPATSLAARWILGCAIAHHSSRFARPGMTSECVARGNLTQIATFQLRLHSYSKTAWQPSRNCDEPGTPFGGLTDFKSKSILISPLPDYSTA